MTLLRFLAAAQERYLAFRYPRRCPCCNRRLTR